MFYNKSRIVEFYTNTLDNFDEKFSRKPDLVCLSGSMLCNGIWMTLQKDHCMQYENFEAFASYPFFPIPDLFCEAATKQFMFERLVMETFLVLKTRKKCLSAQCLIRLKGNIRFSED
jgi:hypothetical protein